MTIEKQTLLETILFADVKEGGTKMNNIALLKQNLKLFSKETNNILINHITGRFYLLFTSLLDLPEEAKQQFYKEYMYSMTVFSLMSFV